MQERRGTVGFGAGGRLGFMFLWGGWTRKAYYLRIPISKI